MNPSSYLRILALLFATILVSHSSQAQIMTYRLSGTLPAGASSHTQIADGETFVATFLVDTGASDSNGSSTLGIYEGCVISGSLEFSGGYVSPMNFSGFDVNVFNGATVDGVSVRNGSPPNLINFSATNENTNTLNSDEMPSSCVAFNSGPNPASNDYHQLVYEDNNGSIEYYGDVAHNVSFLSYQGNLWISGASSYFDIGSNWSDGSAPGITDSACFGLPAAYEVWWDSITGDVTNENLCIANGIVTLRSVGSAGGVPYQYTITDTAGLDSAVLILGGASGDHHQLNVGDLLTMHDSALCVDHDSILKADTMRIAINSGPTSTMTVEGMFDSSHTMVGDLGDGIMHIQNTGVVNAANVDVGCDPGSSGMVLISGVGSSCISTLEFDVGDFGTGTLIIEDGGLLHSRFSAVGYRDNSNGHALVTGTDSCWIIDEVFDVGVVGNSQGVLDIEAGAEVKARDVRVGVAPVNSNKQINIRHFGSKLYATDDIQIGVNSLGEINVLQGGIIDADMNVIVYPLGSLNLNDSAGQAFVFANEVQNSGLISFECPIPDVYANVVNTGFIQSLNNAATRIFGNLQHDSGFVYNDSNAKTEISGVASGAGRYTGTGEVEFAWRFRPGAGDGINAIAEIEFDGDVNQLTSTKIELEIAGAAHDEFDRLVIDGDCNVDGELIVLPVGGFTFSEGQEFVIYEIGGNRTGQFGSLDEGDVVGTFDGLDLMITYAGGDGNDIALFTAGGLLGDINCDGVVNLLDVDPFIDLLSSGGYSPKADFDGDGAVTLLDVSGFVEALAGA